MANVVDLTDKGWWKNQREADKPTVVKKKRALSKKYFTVKELAIILKISTDHIYCAIKSGTLKSQSIGKVKRISEEDFTDYLNFLTQKHG
jgi:excisionase family DNA binding protein